MKKQLLKSALILAAGVGLFAGVASATEWTGGDCIDGICTAAGGVTTNYDASYNNVVVFDSVNKSNTWTFNLDSWSAPTWNINPEDFITKATVSFDIYDNDLQAGTKLEKIKVTADYGLGGSWTFSTASTDTRLADIYQNLNLFQMFSLADHQLKVTMDNQLIDGQYGTFEVRVAELSGEYCDVNPVPEPATMLLFGTGVAGLAGIARRKRS